MGKYCFSFPARSLFAMLIALSLLLLLLLLQSPYSGSAASGKSGSGARSRNRQAGKILPEQEVTALNDILRMSTLPEPALKDILQMSTLKPALNDMVSSFTVNSCFQNSIRKRIACNCDPVPMCRVRRKTISAELSEPGSSNSSQGSSAANKEQRPGFDKRNVGDCQRVCHVQEIYLDGLKLNGVIPSSLVNLTYLEQLDLSDNDLTGEIPGGVLVSLKRLEYLSLSRNFLNGSIPKELGQLTSLSLLSLWANRLTGEIPEELGNLSNLTYLDLSNNQLTGKLPVKLEQLKQLETLDLNDNTITGALPKEFSKLKSLERL